MGILVFRESNSSPLLDKDGDHQPLCLFISVCLSNIVLYFFFIFIIEVPLKPKGKREGGIGRMRPDRSDAHLPAEEQAKIEEEARKYFRRITPKRHTKPSRSEYSSDYWDHLASSDQSSSSIPEFDKLQNLLQENPHQLVCDGSEVVEEYVETDYYKDLNRIDKQHHTTGTGFIKVEKPSAENFDLALASDTSPYGPPCRGNPATNEWIPSADPVVPVSHKPNRSDI